MTATPAELRALADLGISEKRYLAQRQCGWCGQTLNRESCLASGSKCTPREMADRRESCLATYRARPRLNHGARK